MRTPPPGDITASDAALAELRRRLTEGGPDRRGRYWSAMVSGPGSLDAVLRLVDEELAELRKAYRDAVGVPPSEHQARRLESMAERVETAGEHTKAVERGLDLAQVWDTTEPHSLMSRRRAAAILREVLGP